MGPQGHLHVQSVSLAQEIDFLGGFCIAAQFVYMHDRGARANATPGKEIET